MTVYIDDIITKVSEINQLIKILQLALDNEDSNTCYQYDTFMKLLSEKGEQLFENLEDFEMQMIKEKMEI